MCDLTRAGCLLPNPKGNRTSQGLLSLQGNLKGEESLFDTAIQFLTFHRWDEPGGSLRTLLFGCTVYCSNSHKLVTDSTGPLVQQLLLFWGLVCSIVLSKDNEPFMSRPESCYQSRKIVVSTRSWWCGKLHLFKEQSRWFGTGMTEMDYKLNNGFEIQRREYVQINDCSIIL